MVLDDSRSHAGAHAERRPQLSPDEQWVLFGHHFAAIAGRRPADRSGAGRAVRLPARALWLVVGVCLAGAVHDFIILWASTRRGGASLAEIARTEIGPVAGIVAAVAILFIVVIALAGLGLAVVNALAESAWGCSRSASTIPIALFMGLYMYRFGAGQDRRGDDHRRHRPARSPWSSARPIAASSLGADASCSRSISSSIALGIYGFARVRAAGLDAALRRATISARS